MWVDDDRSSILRYPYFQRCEQTGCANLTDEALETQNPCKWRASWRRRSSNPGTNTFLLATFALLIKQWTFPIIKAAGSLFRQMWRNVYDHCQQMYVWSWPGTGCMYGHTEHARKPSHLNRPDARITRALVIGSNQGRRQPTTCSTNMDSWSQK